MCLLFVRACASGVCSAVCFKGDDADETRLISERLRKSFADLLDREEDRPLGYTEEWLQMIDEGSVPGELLISSLIKESIQHHRGSLPSRTVMLATLVHCLIPSLVRLGKHEPFMGDTWAEIVIAICCFAVSLPNFMAVRETLARRAPLHTIGPERH